MSDSVSEKNSGENSVENDGFARADAASTVDHEHRYVDAPDGSDGAARDIADVPAVEVINTVAVHLMPPSPAGSPTTRTTNATSPKPARSSLRWPGSSSPPLPTSEGITRVRCAMVSARCNLHSEKRRRSRMLPAKAPAKSTRAR